jgi:hypothetical protein
MSGNTSATNLSLSPAAHDLGLGDMVRQQLQDDLDERKKKLLASKGAPGGNTQQALNPATLSLFAGGGMGAGGSLFGG